MNVSLAAIIPVRSSRYDRAELLEPVNVMVTALATVNIKDYVDYVDYAEHESLELVR